MSYTNQDLEAALRRLMVSRDEAAVEWRDSLPNLAGTDPDNPRFDPNHHSSRSNRVEDGPPDEHTPGFCYLLLVRPDARGKFKKALGRNPYLAAVFAWLQNNVSEHSTQRFRLQLGCAPLDTANAPAFTQAHIAVNLGGLRVKQIMASTTLDIRLGADIQRPTEASIGGAGPSQRVVPGPSNGVVVRIPFAAVIRHTAGRVSFSPRTSTGVQALTTYFETAELLAFEASVTVTGGASAILSMGFGAAGRAPINSDGYMSLPHCALIYGDDNSATVGELSLPPDHSFGREVKALSVGNPDPVLYVELDHNTASAAFLRGFMMLCLGGHGVAPPLMLAGSARASTSPAR